MLEETIISGGRRVGASHTGKERVRVATRGGQRWESWAGEASDRSLGYGEAGGSSWANTLLLLSKS